MCRLAAYMGPDLLLHKLLDEPPNSLIKQSWASEELHGTSLNADGFGFGWYADDRQAAIYTNTLPIWSDTNLAGLGRSLHSKLWLAYIRSATPGQAISQANTQPFHDNNLLFLHNGRIEHFNDGPRTALHHYLSAEISAGIQGNTDSEYLFALCRQSLITDGSIQNSLTGVGQDLENILAGTPALLNMVISDGQTIHVCRHAINGGKCPSIYYTATHPHFPDAVVIASERFSQPECWQEINEHSLLIVNPDKTVNTFAI